MSNFDDYKEEEEVLYDLPKKDKILVKKITRKTIELSVFENNSGRGEDAPESISKKFNWGAFLFNFIWGVQYKKWILLLIPAFLFIPYGILVSFGLAIWAGRHGNQWAWEEIEYKDEKDFHKSQRLWVRAWFAILLATLVITSPLLVASYTNIKHKPQITLDHYNFISTLELTIPSKYFDQTSTLDNHADIITSNKYVIYWLRPENTLTKKNLNFIQTAFNNGTKKLHNNFVLYPDIKTLTDKHTTLKELDIEAKCENSYCIDSWLYNRCKNGYCIINPKTQKYYKVRTKEAIIPKAMSLLNKW